LRINSRRVGETSGREEAGNVAPVNWTTGDVPRAAAPHLPGVSEGFGRQADMVNSRIVYGTGV
jgi:hypothetical protein